MQKLIIVHEVSTTVEHVSVRSFLGFGSSKEGFAGERAIHHDQPPVRQNRLQLTESDAGVNCDGDRLPDQITLPKIRVWRDPATVAPRSVSVLSSRSPREASR